MDDAELKRLRELATGALEQPHDVYDPRRSQFINAANPQTVLALLDALAASKAEADKLREALRRCDDLLTDLQPKIPTSCKPGHSVFIDNYVDSALETIRAALAAPAAPKEPT